MLNWLFWAVLTLSVLSVWIAVAILAAAGR
jgi:hypothetical protein